MKNLYCDEVAFPLFRKNLSLSIVVSCFELSFLRLALVVSPFMHASNLIINSYLLVLYKIRFSFFLRVCPSLPLNLP